MGSLPLARVGRKSSKGTERLQAFSDGVFSIVITLLVFQINVPEIQPDRVAAELPGALLALAPQMFSLVLSFMVLGIYWIGHQTIFSHIQTHDRVLLWLNILFLMFIAFVPFVADLFSTYFDQQLTLILYCMVLICAGVVANALWRYATKDRHLLDESVDPEVVKVIQRRVLTAPVGYFVTILVSFVSLNLAKALIVLIALAYILPTPIFYRPHQFSNLFTPEDNEL